MPPEAVPGTLTEHWWQENLANLDARLRVTNLASARLVFLGDSITMGWDPAIWGQYYAPRAALNMGVGGDATQGLLYRLPREWGALRPQLVVLLIGTNNAPTGRHEEIALGIAEAVRFINARSPTTKVLLVGILPRRPADWINDVSGRINALIARCADGERVFYANVGPQLVDAGGALAEAYSPDGLHLNSAGYTVLAAALEPRIRLLLGGR